MPAPTPAQILSVLLTLDRELGTGFLSWFVRGRMCPDSPDVHCSHFQVAGDVVQIWFGHPGHLPCRVSDLFNAMRSAARLCQFVELAFHHPIAGANYFIRFDGMQSPENAGHIILAGPRERG